MSGSCALLPFPVMGRVTFPVALDASRAWTDAPVAVMPMRPAPKLRSCAAVDDPDPAMLRLPDAADDDDLWAGEAMPAVDNAPTAADAFRD
jgi:hypothetical protein